MKTFAYKDCGKAEFQPNKGWVAPVIFTCEAEKLSEADEIYEKAIGKHPSKEKWISVVCN